MDHMDTLPNSALRMGSETSCLQIFQVTEDTSEEDEDAQIEVRTPRIEKSWRKVQEWNITNSRFDPFDHQKSRCSLESSCILVFQDPPAIGPKPEFGTSFLVLAMGQLNLCGNGSNFTTAGPCCCVESFYFGRGQGPFGTHVAGGYGPRDRDRERDRGGQPLSLAVSCARQPFGQMVLKWIGLNSASKNILWIPMAISGYFRLFWISLRLWTPFCSKATDGATVVTATTATAGTAGTVVTVVTVVGWTATTDEETEGKAGMGC